MLHKCRQRFVISFGRGVFKLVWGQGAFTPGIHRSLFLMQIDVGLRGVSFGLHRVFIFKIVLVV